MGNLLYVLIVILLVFWLLGAFVWSAGGLIHLLLVVVLILFILKVIGGRAP
jgi:hypothetical protein